MYTRDAYLTSLEIINLTFFCVILFSFPFLSFPVEFYERIIIDELTLLLSPCVSLSLGLSVFSFSLPSRLSSVVLARTRTSRTDLGEIPRRTRDREFLVEIIYQRN